uniref:TcpE family conjugal transfer membrane protein n=1 Tax=Streptococcus pluranimalium TaxID=82348 RepID=UPI003F68FE57
MERKDKKLYSYKQALSQPYWIQRLNDNLHLPSPIRLSQIIYAVLLIGFFWYLFLLLIPFTATGFRGTLSALLGWLIAGNLSELIVDGKLLIVYLRDYVIFYSQYGMRNDSIYINKGQIYQKPQAIIKRKE